MPLPAPAKGVRPAKQSKPATTRTTKEDKAAYPTRHQVDCPLTARPILTLTPETGEDSPQTLAYTLLDGAGDWAGLRALLSIDFSEHDARLYQCLLSAIDQVQAHTGRLIGSYTATLSYAEVYDAQPLPVGPITGAVTVTAPDGTTFTGKPYPVLSGEFPLLAGTFSNGLALRFTAGYTRLTMPARLREAVLLCAANDFDGGERNWFRKVADLRLRSWGS